MKRHVIAALTALMLVGSVPLVALAAPASVKAAHAQARIRAGTISPTRDGKYRVALDKRQMAEAYRTVVRMARAAGKAAPSRAAFRADVQRQIYTRMHERFPTGLPAAARATLLIIITVTSTGTTVFIPV